MAIGDKLFIADKPTLDTVKTNVDTANGNIVLVKTNVDTANNSITAMTSKIGTNTDVAGTSTVFARVRQIYEYLTTNLSSTRATKIDNLDATVSSRATATALTAVDTKVGVANSSTAGTDTLFNYMKKIWDKVATITAGATASDVWSYATRGNTVPAPNMIMPSTNVRISAPTEKILTQFISQSESSAVKVKEFVVPWAGIVRVQADVLSALPTQPNGYNLASALFIVRVNGVTVATLSHAYSAYTQLATNVAVKAGDIVSIHITTAYWFDPDPCGGNVARAVSTNIKNAGIAFDFASIYGYTSLD